MLGQLAEDWSDLFFRMPCVESLACPELYRRQDPVQQHEDETQDADSHALPATYSQSGCAMQAFRSVWFRSQRRPRAADAGGCEEAGRSPTKIRAASLVI